MIKADNNGTIIKRISRLQFDGTTKIIGNKSLSRSQIINGSCRSGKKSSKNSDKRVKINHLFKDETFVENTHL